MQAISVDDLTRRVENTLYTAVGLGILGFQHVQVQRRQLARSLDAVVRQVTARPDRPSARG